jgi:hypothetical protein
MEILLPLVALAALVVAGGYWVRARTASSELKASRERLTALTHERDELKEGQVKRQSKEQSRQIELDELRERQKDLKRKLAETQELAKKVKDVEAARREVEEDAHASVQRSRTESLAAQAEARALRAELDQLRVRRPVSAARVDPLPVADAPVIESAPVPTPPQSSVAELALQAAVQELEAKLAGERTRHLEAQEKARQEQKKAQDTVRELERHRAKLATAEKLYMVQKGELEVWKDRYRTLEQRLNRSLREIDALQRGVLALEKRLPQASVQAARDEVARAEAARLAATAAQEAKALAEAAAEPVEGGDSLEATEESPAPIGAEPASPPASPESGETGLEAKGTEPS